MKKTTTLLLMCILLIGMNSAFAQCNASFTFAQDSGFVQFTNTSTSGPSGFYSQWYYGDGTTGWGNNTSHQYQNTGTYTVILYITANDSTCFDTVSTTITVTSIMTSATCQANFSRYSTSADSLTWQFTNQSYSSGPYSLYWTFGDGDSSFATNPVHTYPSSGTYTVCLTIYNQATSCSDTYCYPLTIYVPSSTSCQAGFYIFQETTPGLYSFYNTSSGNNLNYTWSFGDGTSSNNISPMHTYANSGTYTISLLVTSSTDSTCYDYFSTTLLVNLTPSACNAEFYITQDSVNANHYYIYNASTGSNLNYYWNFGDGTTDSIPYPTHTYQDSMAYSICLTIWNQQCQSIYCDSLFAGRSTGTITVTVLPAPLGVKEQQAEKISVYPNPATDVLNIKIPTETTGEISLMDLSGRLLNQSPLTSSTTQMLDVSSLPKGLYLIRVTTTDQKQFMSTFVK